MPQLKTELLAKRSLYAYRHITIRANIPSSVHFLSAAIPLHKNACLLRVRIVRRFLLQVATQHTHIFNTPTQKLDVMLSSGAEATGRELIIFSHIACRQD
jgi:hypothetical protein